jgi:acetoin:2,6-dichlorophenolindophenol oxidoreductase subunit beta
MSMPREITFIEAIREALTEEMERDERVFILGEDVGRMGGSYGATAGLLERFGEKRVIDTPISEALIVGAAVGAAITGLRPIPELMFSDFIANAMDEVVHKAGKWRYMHGGLFNVPLVLRLPEGAAGGAGPEHSQCPEGLLWNAPGLYVVIPSTPADAKGLMKSAIRDNNPVCFFEHKVLYYMTGEVPDGEHLVPLGKADIKREGKDVTVVAWALMVHKALEAAEQLAAEGISVEVIDPRGLRPLDMDTIIHSLEKTGRIVFVQEAPRTGGPAGEIMALIAEQNLDLLAAPIKRVAAPDIPVPQNMRMEQLYVPSVADIIAAIREVV